jgi:hypothetical protein
LATEDLCGAADAGERLATDGIADPTPGERD